MKSGPEAKGELCQVRSSVTLWLAQHQWKSDLRLLRTARVSWSVFPSVSGSACQLMGERRNYSRGRGKCGASVALSLGCCAGKISLMISMPWCRASMASPLHSLYEVRNICEATSLFASALGSSRGRHTVSSSFPLTLLFPLQ